MINIRPVSDDLRNKLPEPKKTAMGSDESVFLKKNGYGGTRVLFSTIFPMSWSYTNKLR